MMQKMCKKCAKKTHDAKNLQKLNIVKKTGKHD